MTDIVTERIARLREKMKQTGTGLVAVGPGKAGEKDEEVKPMTLKAGDKVIYFKYAGDKMYDSEGAEYIVLADRDILATM